MKIMRLILKIIFLILIGRFNAQAQLPTIIKISCGSMRSPFFKITHDTKFDKQLIYIIADSSFLCKKRERQQFKKLALKPTGLFLYNSTYFQLDSLLKTMPDNTYPIDKEVSYIYRLELIYSNDFTSKIVSSEFAGNINKPVYGPSVLLTQMINEFLTIIKNAP